MQFSSGLVLMLASWAAATPVAPRSSVGTEHLEALEMRASKSVNPAAARNTKCIDPKVYASFLL